MRIVYNLRLTITLILFLAFTTCLGVAQGSGGQDPAASNLSANKTNGIQDAASTGLQFQRRDSRYEIRAGDSFDLTFELSPEFNQTGVIVQPDGFVTLRGIGDCKVEGQTVPQLTQTLRTAYGKILNDPIITVIPKDFEKPYFIADGQIGHPGKYDLRGRVTLTEAVAMAGGFTEHAKHSQVLLFRRVSDQWMEAKIINIKKMQKTGSLAEDPILHPGDMLFVPKNMYSKIERYIPTANIGAFSPL